MVPGPLGPLPPLFRSLPDYYLGFLQNIRPIVDMEHVDRIGS